MFIFLIGVLMTLTAAPVAKASEWSFKSEDQHVHLLELYTSEGCSSCPPIDRWYSSLMNHPRLWKSFVPLAFHVDYWDDLGWRDPYSSKLHSERQRSIASRWKNPSVYTPGLILDGREFRRNQIPQLTETKKSRGKLRIDLVRRGSSLDARVGFASADTQYRPKSYFMHVVVMGHNLKELVKKGENAGRTLIHDFTVLHWQKQKFEAGSGRLTGTFKFDNLKALPSERLSIGTWIENETGEYLQASGGFLK